MGEAKVGADVIKHETAASEGNDSDFYDARAEFADRGSGGMTQDRDPGAFLGQKPEREEETIPGGVKPGDQRVAAYDAAPGVAGEPDMDEESTEFDRHREAGQDR